MACLCQTSQPESTENATRGAPMERAVRLGYGNVERVKPAMTLKCLWHFGSNNDKGDALQ